MVDDQFRQVVNNDKEFDIAYRGNGAGPLAYEMDIFYQSEEYLTHTNLNVQAPQPPAFDRAMLETIAADDYLRMILP